MYTLFISKISKVLGLNQWENPKHYEDAILAREFGLVSVDLRETEHKYFDSSGIADLPQIKFEKKILRGLHLPPDLQYYKGLPTGKTLRTRESQQCRYGIQNENLVIDYLRSTPNNYNIISQQKTVIYRLTNRFRLLGKIDGERCYRKGGNHLIEVKSRMSRFVGVRPHEMVQVQLYLLASDLKTCLFVESCNRKLKCHIVKRDEPYLKILLEQIMNLVKHFDSFWQR